jgi:DNA-binding response OmpR family regulator
LPWTDDRAAFEFVGHDAEITHEMHDPGTTPDERVRAALRDVWNRSRPEIEDRVRAVADAIAAALAGELGEAQRAGAERAAHRLAGSLGTLGLPEGGAAARELERALERAPIPQADLPRLAGLANELRERVAGGPAGPEPVRAAPADEVEPVAPPDPSPGARIVAVDDDPAIREALEAVLSQAGFEVETLAAPDTLAQVLDARPADALILDLAMPGVDGLDVCRRLRGTPAWNALPILVLTARNDPETIDDVFAAGADDFMAKPISGPQLVARLENRLARTTAQRASAAAHAGSGPDGTVDVVVVEDDPAIADLLLHALETRGLRTRWIEDGSTASAVLAGERPEVMPRLVLLDVDLPGLDGLSLLRRLAREGSLERTRVVMLTARAGEREVLAALELGAVDHVAKPFSLPVLLERVRATLARG